jgi:hypothetical protein
MNRSKSKSKSKGKGKSTINKTNNKTNNISAKSRKISQNKRNPSGNEQTFRELTSPKTIEYSKS